MGNYYYLLKILTEKNIKNGMSIEEAKDKAFKHLDEKRLLSPHTIERIKRKLCGKYYEFNDF